MTKQTKRSVGYGKGNMQDHCSVCRHFEPPKACEKVAGEISRDGWCRLFARKKPGQQQ